MKSTKNKIFVVILFLTVAFSPVVVPAAHAGNTMDVLNIFSGGALGLIQVGFDATVAATNFTIDATMAVTNVMIDATVIAINNAVSVGVAIGSGVTASLIGPAIINAAIGNNLPTDNLSGNLNIIAGTTFILGGDLLTAVILCGEGVTCSNDNNTPLLISLKPSESGDQTCVLQIPLTFYIPNFNKEDETHNKIAIYRIVEPISKFTTDGSTDVTKVDSQALGLWFLGRNNNIPDYYNGSGGGFLDKIGSGWGIGQSTMSQWDYWKGARYFTGDAHFDWTLQQNVGGYATTDSPILTIDYSAICKDDVCTIIDADNIPENSIIVYAAKILGNYAEPVVYVNQYCSVGEGDAAMSVPCSPTYITEKNKFLSTVRIPANAYVTWGFPYVPDLASFPYQSLRAPGNYEIGNVYLGPIRTGVAASCATDSKCCSSQNLSSFTLSVSKPITNTGTGTVTSVPTGINCGTTCSFPFPISSSVTLTATPGAGSTFTNWADSTGAPICTSTSTTCAITMDEAKTVQAIFTADGGGSVPGCAVPVTYKCSILTSVASCSDPANCGKSIVEQKDYCYEYCSGTLTGNIANKALCSPACAPEPAAKDCGSSACTVHTGTWREVAP